ncbi:MAG TPA: sulfatase [Armatimonadota bacterium]|nr:sulfatase [Armatimonadota bacterium]HOM82848.1 sulfatase [Armatimonadota bacterium]HPO74810.1 sulfatase [Armatimonadota bacterium]
MGRLNILYIHSHDTGRYVQPYGYAVETPRIQQLAEEGVLFRQAFCANPTCSASRSVLLTGRYAHSNGMIGLAHRGSRLNDYRQHLASFLSRNGYETALSGMQHEAADRQLLGYERFLDDGPGGNTQEGVARRAAAFLAERHDRPFFLSCGFSLTHRTGRGIQWHNGEASPLGDPRYCRPPAPLPDLPEIRRDFADFRASVRRLDECMGIVFDALEESGLAEETLVVCTTDHGIAFPFMKCNLTDHGTGVMLILRGPGGFTGGKVVDALVSHVDIFPTLCQMAGIPQPDWLQGTSLMPLVTGDAESVRDEVFAEVNYHAAREPMRSVRTARYRYIRRYEVHPHPVLPNCDESVSKRELLRYGWRERPQQEEALYDLIFDPNEACNVAKDPLYADALAEMRARLNRWMRETEDPLLTGRMEPWPGMASNPVDGNSPQEEAGPAEPWVAR